MRHTKNSDEKGQVSEAMQLVGLDPSDTDVLEKSDAPEEEEKQGGKEKQGKKRKRKREAASGGKLELAGQVPFNPLVTAEKT